MAAAQSERQVEVYPVCLQPERDVHDDQREQMPEYDVSSSNDAFESPRILLSKAQLVDTCVRSRVEAAFEGYSSVVLAYGDAAQRHDCMLCMPEETPKADAETNEPESERAPFCPTSPDPAAGPALPTSTKDNPPAEADLLGNAEPTTSQADVSTHTPASTPACRGSGVIEEAFRLLSDGATAARKRTNRVALRASFLQIHDNQVQDLLVSRHTSDVVIRDADPEKEPIIMGCEEVPVATVDDLMECLAAGAARRRALAGAADDDDAAWTNHLLASHAIFIVHVIQHTMTTTDSGAAAGEVVVHGKVAFADLAFVKTLRASPAAAKAPGTPSDATRVPDVDAQTFPPRAIKHKETGLAVLAHVAEALAAGRALVPHKQHALTRILRPALSGSWLTAVLAFVTAANTSADQQTLEFARGLARLHTRPRATIMKVDLSSEVIAWMRRENAGLAKELAGVRKENRVLEKYVGHHGERNVKIWDVLRDAEEARAEARTANGRADGLEAELAAARAALEAAHAATVKANTRAALAASQASAAQRTAADAGARATAMEAAVERMAARMASRDRAEETTLATADSTSQLATPQSASTPRTSAHAATSSRFLASRTDSDDSVTVSLRVGEDEHVSVAFIAMLPPATSAEAMRASIDVNAAHEAIRQRLRSATSAARRRSAVQRRLAARAAEGATPSASAAERLAARLTRIADHAEAVSSARSHRSQRRRDTAELDDESFRLLSRYDDRNACSLADDLHVGPSDAALAGAAATSSSGVCPCCRGILNNALRSGGGTSGDGEVGGAPWAQEARAWPADIGTDVWGWLSAFSALAARASLQKAGSVGPSNQEGAAGTHCGEAPGENPRPSSGADSHASGSFTLEQTINVLFPAIGAAPPSAPMLEAIWGWLLPPAQQQQPPTSSGDAPRPSGGLAYCADVPTVSLITGTHGGHEPGVYADAAALRSAAKESSKEVGNAADNEEGDASNAEAADSAQVQRYVLANVLQNLLTQALRAKVRAIELSKAAALFPIEMQERDEVISAQKEALSASADALRAAAAERGVLCAAVDEAAASRAMFEETVNNLVSAKLAHATADATVRQLRDQIEALSEGSKAEQAAAASTWAAASSAYWPRSLSTRNVSAAFSRAWSAWGSVRASRDLDSADNRGAADTAVRRRRSGRLGSVSGTSSEVKAEGAHLSNGGIHAHLVENHVSSSPGGQADAFKVGEPFCTVPVSSRQPGQAP